METKSNVFITKLIKYQQSAWPLFMQANDKQPPQHMVQMDRQDSKSPE